MNEKVLVVAAHADDEVLGCGGTIAKHAKNGDEVTLVLMADGVGSRDGSENLDYSKRKEAAEHSARILGIRKIIQLDLPDNAMDSLPLLHVVKKLEKATEQLSPKIIYTHHHGDLNIDHRFTFQAVMTVFRPFPGSPVHEIHSFEVMSSTEWNGTASNRFIPDYFVDITEFLPIKIKALEAYQEEMRDSPHSRSLGHLVALAHHRGNSVGLEAAEGFKVSRVIKR